MHVHRLLIQTRRASTSANAFPFPGHSHPTPHQIFHLPYGASQQDVKSRYYDLVRIYHPDSPHCRHLDSAVRHSRFQAISSAYASLMGKRSAGSISGGMDPIYAELNRRRRFQDAQRQYERRTVFDDDVHGFGRPRSGWNANPDDRWKDWVIICVGVVSLGVGLLPASLWTSRSFFDSTHHAASTNLAAARSDARIHGAARREQIHLKVQEYKGRDNNQEGQR